MKVEIFDTTLRDGSQGAGISFSVEDKLKIARALAGFGIHYIEGGWPGSNPKDEDFFRLAVRDKKIFPKLVAFGSTCHRDVPAHQDKNLLAIISSRVKIACIFGKSWDLHVKYALKTSNEHNLRLVYDSIKFLRSRGLKVIFDAEHFFDGFRSNPEYARAVLKKAIEAGAFNITLAETNGGAIPSFVSQVVRQVKNWFPEVYLGIHTHNDSDCAVANTLVAVEAGCRLVQGTINGYGERCGNANLCSVIPGLQLKMGYKCVPAANLKKLTELSRYVDEIANVFSSDKLPYVGRNAFAHKGGVHVSAMARHKKTYEHISPEDVGNTRRILISELSGKSNILARAREMELQLGPEDIARVIAVIKRQENLGFQYEDADASFVLLVDKELGKYKPFFELKSFRVIVTRNEQGKMGAEAVIKLMVDGKIEHTVAEGDGPVNALDNALRKALLRFYPRVNEIALRDFKVRVINAGAGTAAKVRVLIETADQHGSWGTIGVSENIIEASWQALVDAVEYKLLRSRRAGGKNEK